MAPSRIRILTWNLWHGLNPYEPLRMSPMETAEQHRLRYDRQLSVLNAWRRSSPAVEVLCFQEVNPIQERFDELGDGLELEGGACLVNAGVKLAGVGVPAGLQEGLATFAGRAFSEPAFDQLTLSGRAFELRSPRRAPLFVLQGSERRKALLTRLRLEESRLGVVNLHLHHGPDTRSANRARKRSELARLCEWLEPQLAEWDLTVICGDFNCDPDSPCLEPLRKLGFEDWSRLAGVSPEPTWVPDQNPHAERSAHSAGTAEAHAWDGAPHVFDRIYLRMRRPVRVLGHGLLREPELSDHFGVWVELEQA